VADGLFSSLISACAVDSTGAGFDGGSYSVMAVLSTSLVGLISCQGGGHFGC
jgi:hypothetical protein